MDPLGLYATALSGDTPPSEADSYESVDPGVCCAPVPAAADIGGADLTVIPAVEVLRDEWSALFAKMQFAVDQGGVWFRRCAELDAELFRLCPCPRRQVDLRNVLVDLGDDEDAGGSWGGGGGGDGGGGDKDDDAERVREIAVRLSEAFRAVASLHALLLSASAGVRVMNAAVGSMDGAYAKHASANALMLLRALDLANAQISAQFVRIADLETKERHVTSVATGPTAEAYEQVLRATVRESERAVLALGDVRSVLIREVRSAVEYGQGGSARVRHAEEEMIRAAFDENEEVRKLMENLGLDGGLEISKDLSDSGSSGSGIIRGVVDNAGDEEDLARLERMCSGDDPRGPLGDGLLVDPQDTGLSAGEEEEEEEDDYPRTSSGGISSDLLKHYLA